MTVKDLMMPEIFRTVILIIQLIVLGSWVVIITVVIPVVYLKKKFSKKGGKIV